MEDVILVNDQWYFSATSPRADARTQVLKQGDTFAVFDRRGEMGKSGLGEQGLYHLGMRHLDQWEILLNGRRPMLLNSTIKEDNSLLVVECTTPDIHDGNEVTLPKGTLHVFRSITVQDSILYEHLRLTNYSRNPLELVIEYSYGADFHDMFEVRGAHRARRGEALPPEIEGKRVTLGYRGLDDVVRRTIIEFDGEVLQLTDRIAKVRVRLKPGQEQTLHATIGCLSGNAQFCVVSYAEAVEGTKTRLRRREQQRARIVTSNEQFNHWIDRSLADLQMLTTETVYGSYPYAGVPWFSTPFGRDGIITALQTLWLDPELSRGALSFLAATQATEKDPKSDAEPGKILHEMREGEMSALGEVPFRRYYGTVDATPLFVVLAGRYFRRTDDLAFIRDIWPNIKQAVNWMNTYGDADGDGFVEYQRCNDRGLVQQGWKDSDDSIFHSDGSPAEGPIALCEVQGYVYEAKLLAAELAEALDERDWAAELRQQAAVLKEYFNEKFWVRSINTFAIALDGRKRPCAVRSSNTGHLLYNGIVDAQHAGAVAETLMSEQSFNGWGIRTIAEGEARYNPMSYHNGSVWPHDTGIAAAGLARYGDQSRALQLVSGLFEASQYLDNARLPELFCGFPRLEGHSPTLYPVACSPQAWAAGAVFMLLQACLGMTFSPTKPQICFDHPRLPETLQWVRISNLRMKQGMVNMTLRRHPRDVGLNIDEKEGDIDIVLIA
ncbi:amylo-alpha-1,6-glucosidase [Planctomicrobium piriforme]|uniref:Glycogen debranching enzyme (Alpha-1,6-glucosidase) n=1 Tax=Planctomicrobium piriforme TaxID=1576369 RepID=A0A1I3FFX1_9PLAN|nr:amylo-alpha-1,6-glucosidase [Planctomicrobium piriforme]SFI10086.1 Glycogen debranching enzyme (alpha-1,6-glucosidase) [Planctomicrobium piriforme]